MTASMAYDPQAMTGYRLEQLAGAFDRVRNPRDWKAPVRATIPASSQAVVRQAVLWFTETAATFDAIPGESDLLLVQAPGYRLGPAGSPAEDVAA